MLLVFFGLSTVAGAVMLELHAGLFQVALLWGLGLTLAIAVAWQSGAHLNPAMTLAFATLQGFSWKKVPVYIGAQLLGALLGALLMYCLFSGVIEAYELANQIDRGGRGSELSSMMFGEYYPNPAMLAGGMDFLLGVGTVQALSAEILGTAVLAFVIFTLSKYGAVFPQWVVYIMIGMTLTVLIAIMAPFSMAGFNPARDLMPRLLACVLGWGDVVFSYNGHGWWLVYIVGPILGAQLGGACFGLINTPSKKSQ